MNDTTTGQSSVVALIAGATLNAIMDEEDDGNDELLQGEANDSAALLVNFYDKLMHQAVLNSFNISREYIESTLEPENGSGDDVTTASTAATVLLMVKALIIGFIILAAIFGNMLVIVSVMQHRRLR